MPFGGEEKVQEVGFDGTDLRAEVSIDFLHLGRHEVPVVFDF